MTNLCALDGFDPRIDGDSKFGNAPYILGVIRSQDLPAYCFCRRDSSSPLLVKVMLELPHLMYIWQIYRAASQVLRPPRQATSSRPVNGATMRPGLYLCRRI